MKPQCYRCGEKLAKPLKSLPGQYGQVAYFCSMQCAAIDGVEGPMARCLEWCEIHGEWFDEECFECGAMENE